MDDVLKRMRGCFQPRQWFQADGEPDPNVISDEDVFMWVYLTKDGKYQVGYYGPDGSWFCDSEHETSAAASARVNYLNGGKQEKRGYEG